MSLLEMETEIRQMTSAQRAELQEIIAAAEEGVSVEELRKIDAALAEAEEGVEDSDCLTVEQVRASLGMT